MCMEADSTCPASALHVIREGEISLPTGALGSTIIATKFLRWCFVLSQIRRASGGLMFLEAQQAVPIVFESSTVNNATVNDKTDHLGHHEGGGHKLNRV